MSEIRSFMLRLVSKIGVEKRRQTHKEPNWRVAAVARRNGISDGWLVEVAGVEYASEAVRRTAFSSANRRG
jgi:hypothetical protein